MSTLARRRRLLVESLEDRTVPSATLTDDFGNTFATAQMLTLPAPPVVNQLGQIDYLGDVDVFRFVAPATGSLTARALPSFFSDYRGMLRVFDDQGRLLARGTSAGDTTTAQVAFDGLAGQTYFLEVGATPGTLVTDVQRYVLTLNGYADDAGNTLNSASILTLSAEGRGSTSGTIEVPSDADFFRFTATTTGGMTVRLAATDDSGLDPQLALFDVAGNELDHNDDDGRTLNALLTFDVVAGQTYFLRASGSPDGISGTATGDYLLQLLTFIDSAGSSPGNAAALTFDPSGLASVSATIGATGDTDLYQLTPPSSGSVVVDLSASASSLAPSLALLDAGGLLLASNEGLDAPARSARLVLHLQAGPTYYLRAAGASGTAGAYTLSVRAYADDTGNVHTEAAELMLNGAGQGTRPGNFEVAGDSDFYSFVAPFSGDLALTLAPVGSTLGGRIVVTNAARQVLASNRLADSSGVVRVIFAATAGQTYFVQASARPGDRGGYDLSLAPLVDEVGDTLATASSLTFSGNLAARSAAIGTADRDVFRLVVPSASSFAVHVSAAPGGTLSPVLSLFDDAGMELGSIFAVSGRSDAQLTFAGTPGQVLYVRVEGGNNPGAYSLLVSPYTDDAGNSSATAISLTLQPAATTTVDGRLETVGDSDHFRFVAPFSGPLTIRQSANESSLDSLLTLMDAAGNVLAQDDESGGDHNARLTFDVTVGQTYLVSAAAYPFASTSRSEVGAYRLTFAPLLDDFGDTLATAADLSLSLSGSTEQLGEIGKPGDVDLFRFTASVSGGLTIRQEASGSFLDPFLTLLDDAGNLLASNDDADGTLNSRLDVSIEAGRTYYLQAGAFSASTGAYRLTLVNVVDDFGDDLASAEDVTLGLDVLTIRGGIQVSGDVDVFRFTAPVTAGVVFSQRASGSGLDSLLTILDAAGNVLASNDDSGPGLDSQIILDLVAGQTYGVRAGAFASSRGEYVLEALVYPDDAPNQSADAITLTVDDTGRGERVGNVEVIGDVDYYRLVSPINGLPTVTLQSVATSQFLDAYLLIEDSAGNLVGLSDDAGGTLDSEVIFLAVQGEEYTVRASASPATSDGLLVGTYRLAVAPPVIAPPPTPEDDFGNDQASATALTLADDGTAAIAGRREILGDVDFFSLQVASTGLLTFELRAGSSLFDPLLAILDSSGNVLAFSDDANGLLDCRATVFALAGQTLYVQVSGFSTSTGDYVLSVHPEISYADDLGSSRSHAILFPVDVNLPLDLSGTIETGWDSDLLGIGTLTAGETAIRLTPASGSLLDAELRIYDAQGQLLSRIDGSGPAVETTLAVGSSQVYYLGIGSARLGPGTTGGYQLQVVYHLDDVGDAVSGATGLTQDGLGRASTTARIGAAGDVDVFQFSAPAEQVFAVRVEPLTPGFLPTLAVLDSSGTPLATFAGPDGELRFTARAGQTYFARVSGLVGQGDFQLFVGPAQDQVGPAFPDVVWLDIEAESSPRIDALETIGDVDTYTFLADTTGLVLIRVQGLPGGVIPALEAVDVQGNVLAFSEGLSEGAARAEVLLATQAGQFYDLRIRGSAQAPAANRLGGYMLSAVRETPVLLPTGISPASIVSGAIVNAGGVEFYRLIASSTGALTVSLDAAGSSLDPALTLYGPTGVMLAQSDDANGSLDAELIFNVVAGQTYFLEAGASPRASGLAAVGAFTLSLQMGEPLPDLLPTVSVLTLDPAGRGTASGIIELPGQRQTYRFQATTSGVLTVEAAAAGLESVVYVFNDQDQLLASAVADASNRAQATFEATARQTYYIRVAASPFATGPTVGSFNLLVGPDDNGSSFASAVTLTQGSTTGSLDGSTDADAFQFTATTAGLASLDVSSLSGGRTSTIVSVFDANGDLLGSGAETLTFVVANGQSYFVRVENAGNTTGKYDLSLDVQASDPFFAEPTPVDPFVSDLGAGSGSSSSSSTSGDANLVSGLTLFTDPANLVSDPGELSGDLTFADLAAVEDSALAFVAVLLVGDGDEGIDLEGQLPEDETGLDIIWPGTTVEESGGRLDAVFLAWEQLQSSLLAELEDAASGLSALLPESVRERWSDAVDAVMKSLGPLAEKIASRFRLRWQEPPFLQPVPGINDLLIPDPVTPRPSSGAEATPLPEEGEPIMLEGQSALILLGGSLALARTKPRKKRVSEQ